MPVLLSPPHPLVGLLSLNKQLNHIPVERHHKRCGCLADLFLCLWLDQCRILGRQCVEEMVTLPPTLSKFSIDQGEGLDHPIPFFVPQSLHYELSPGGVWNEVAQGIILTGQRSVNVTHGDLRTFCRTISVRNGVCLMVPKQSQSRFLRIGFAKPKKSRAQHWPISTLRAGVLFLVKLCRQLST